MIQCTCTNNGLFYISLACRNTEDRLLEKVGSHQVCIHLVCIICVCVLLSVHDYVCL